MTNVKSQAYSVDIVRLKQDISGFLNQFQLRTEEVRSNDQIETLVQSEGGIRAQASVLAGKVQEESATLKKQLKGLFTEEQIQEFLFARNLINERFTGYIKYFLLLALSGSISDLARRRKGRLFEVLTLRLIKLMYFRLYLFDKINETLGIDVGESVAYVCDNRDPFNTAKSLDGEGEKLVPGSVDAIVTSPPYSTAVDYIRNDFPQLTILNLIKSPDELEELERNLEGNPKPRIYRSDELLKEIENGSEFHRNLPEEAKISIQRLHDALRVPEALRSYKFFKDMYLSLIAMNKMLKMGGRCAIVIGNNHYKIDEGTVEEVKNDRIMLQLAIRNEVGFTKDKLTDGIIERPIEKTQAGYIRNESVLILQKIKEATKPEFHLQ
jgi:hypothetical protein